MKAPEVDKRTFIVQSDLTYPHTSVSDETVQIR